jgi:hypothetical protein
VEIYQYPTQESREQGVALNGAAPILLVACQDAAAFLRGRVNEGECEAAIQRAIEQVSRPASQLKSRRRWPDTAVREWKLRTFEAESLV